MRSADSFRPRERPPNLSGKPVPGAGKTTSVASRTGNWLAAKPLSILFQLLLLELLQVSSPNLTPVDCSKNQPARSQQLFLSTQADPDGWRAPWRSPGRSFGGEQAEARSLPTSGANNFAEETVNATYGAPEALEDNAHPSRKWARVKRSQPDTAKRKPVKGSLVVQGLLRGRAVLTCNLEPPESDDAVSLVLWYKDKSMVPIYSIDARSSPVQEGRHKPGPWLEGRSSVKILPGQSKRDWSRQRRQALDDRNRTTSELYAFGEPAGRRRLRWRRQRRSRHHFLPDDSPLWSAATDFPQLPQPLALSDGQQLSAHLLIESLSSEDNGLYSCRVDFRKARSRTQETILRIVVPPDKPTIKDLTEAPAEGESGGGGNGWRANAGANMVGPHAEGATLVLQCETQGGYPEPRLSWWRDGRLVDDSYEIVSSLDGSIIERHSSSIQRGTEGGNALGDNEDNEASDSEDDGPPRSGETEPPPEEPTGASALLPATTDSPGRQQASQNRLIRNRLELPGLSRADLLANYSCQAWNTKLSEPPTSSVMIDMNLRPIKVQIENERQPVQADKPLDVICRASGSRPEALISWYKNGVRLTPAGSRSARDILAGSGSLVQLTAAAMSGRHFGPAGQLAAKTNSENFVNIQEANGGPDANVTTSTLSFVPQLEDAGRIISCRAENRLIKQQLPAHFIEDSWKLDVHFLPRVHLALGEKLSDKKPINEGQDVYFDCTVRAHPQATDIRWWFQGRELATNLTQGVIISNQSLVLQHVNRHQRGRYTCSAVNQLGESQSNSVYLQVQYAPFCRDSGQPERASSPDGNGSQHRFKSHYGAARLESVRVYCHVDANPVDSLTYKWAFVASGKQDELNQQQQHQQQTKFSGQQLVYLDSSLIEPSRPDSPLVSVASYTPRSELDYGTLLCWAQNAIGQQQEPCAYQVVPADKPDPVRNCRLLNATDSQLIVSCEPGYDGGVDQSFQMEVYETLDGHKLVANVSSNLIALDPSGTESPNGTSKLGSSSSPAYDQQQNDESELSRPASSLNELSASGTTGKLQKQRHSTSQPSGLLRAPTSKHPEQQIGETVFVTDPVLEPATNYFLSIYSSNQKGSSKPVAFTATTTNLSINGLPVVAPSRGGNHHRYLGDSSHLLGDVLALSWNPFLLVCAITLAIFLLFASITFTLMKYVDFSTGGFLGGSASGSEAYKPGQMSAGQQAAEMARNGSCDDFDDAATSSTSSTSRSAQRARVVALGRTEVKDTPINGLLHQNRSSLLLNAGSGSYLRLKVLQQQQQQLAKLKQSNSDNFLNQLNFNQAESLQLGQPTDSNRQIQAESFCGTLPRNNNARRPIDMNQQGLPAPISLMLGPPRGPNGQQQIYGYNTNESFSLPRVEQLVISGKQYIHHQRGAPAAGPQQQQQLYSQPCKPAGGQQRHLQLTSYPTNNLPSYSAGNQPGEPLEMQDYQAQQQQLVCIGQPDQMMVIDGLLARAREETAKLPASCELDHTDANSNQQQLLKLAGSAYLTGGGGGGGCCGGDSPCQKAEVETEQNRTSDLGDELGDPLDRSGGLCQQHAVHLALVDNNSGMGRNGRTGAIQFASSYLNDSDGLSSGTQRSFGTSTNTNGSPSSSGIHESNNYLTSSSQFGSNHQQQHPASIGGSSSTITSSMGEAGSNIQQQPQPGFEFADESNGGGGGGNLVSVSPLPRKVKGLTSGNKPALAAKPKSSFAGGELFSSGASIGDQYTVYLNGTSDLNNNGAYLSSSSGLPETIFQNTSGVTNKPTRVRILTGYSNLPPSCAGGYYQPSSQEASAEHNPQTASLNHENNHQPNHNHLHTEV